MLSIKAIRIRNTSISEHFGTGTAPPVAMSEGQVWNKESFEFGQSLEAYNIHLSRSVREIVCEPKPCSFHFISFYNSLYRVSFKFLIYLIFKLPCLQKNNIN